MKLITDDSRKEAGETGEGRLWGGQTRGRNQEPRDNGLSGGLELAWVIQMDSDGRLRKRKR